MKAVSTISGKAIPLDRANVDTDQIIPAKHLKRVERTGYGEFCFEAWRKDPDFVLNDPAYAGATVMLTRDNFGSGSSREHAVWALNGIGIEALIGTSFADIFKNNCFQSGVLTIERPAADIDYLMDLVTRAPDTQITIDLASQTITADGEWIQSFEIDPFRKYRLLRGLDDVSMTLEYAPDIERFEQDRPSWMAGSSTG